MSIDDRKLVDIVLASGASIEGNPALADIVLKGLCAKLLEEGQEFPPNFVPLLARRYMDCEEYYHRHAEKLKPLARAAQAVQILEDLGLDVEVARTGIAKLAEKPRPSVARYHRKRKADKKTPE